jgi:hypothetical protein
MMGKAVFRSLFGVMMICAASSGSGAQPPKSGGVKPLPPANIGQLPPAKKVRMLTVPKGAKFIVFALVDVASSSAIPGTRIPVQVKYDFLVDGEETIHRGARGFLEILTASESGRTNGGRLEIKFREIMLRDGRTISLSGGDVYAGGDGGAKRFGLATILFPGVLLLKGQDVNIKRNQEFIVSTAQDEIFPVSE